MFRLDYNLCNILTSHNYPQNQKNRQLWTTDNNLIPECHNGDNDCHLSQTIYNSGYLESSDFIQSSGTK